MGVQKTEMLKEMYTVEDSTPEGSEGSKGSIGSWARDNLFHHMSKNSLYSVCLCSENFRAHKFENNRMNCLGENVKIAQVFILCYGYYLLFSSRFSAESNKWNRKV